MIVSPNLESNSDIERSPKYEYKGITLYKSIPKE